MESANENEKMSGYALSRAWFDFAFENPDKVTASHTAMFLWFIELNNRMGWVDKFAAPASQTMGAAGIRSYNTYKKVFDSLVLFGVVKLIKKSANQYQSCVIALSNFDKSPNKSLDKSVMYHLTDHVINQVCITSQISSSINKQQTINNKLVVEEESVNPEKDFSEKNEEITEAEILSEEREPVQDEFLKGLPADFVLNEEEFAAAKKYLNSQQLKNLTMKQHQIDENQCQAYFRTFYEQKSAFNELRGKTQMDVLKNFYYWVPKYKHAIKQQLIQTGNAGNGNSNPGKFTGKNVATDVKRSELNELGKIARNVVLTAANNQ